MNQITALFKNNWKPGSVFFKKNFQFEKLCRGVVCWLPIRMDTLTLPISHIFISQLDAKVLLKKGV